MSISVLGAGAFGTSLAIALAQEGAEVTLWSRDEAEADAMAKTRASGKRLPGHTLPKSLHVTSDARAFEAEVCLLTIPTQKLASFLSALPTRTQALVACCKGIDHGTGLGPVGLIRKRKPETKAAILTGPSFAADIARGLPTALVLACADEDTAASLQAELTRPTLRLYRTSDVIGAELGGATKNVIALAAGIAIGAGLGDSARASVIARGFSEMQRFAGAKGALPETVQGLSGLGDLVLTCTSEKSRNFMAGVSLGKGNAVETTATVEGIATTPALATQAKALGLELPLVQAIADVIAGDLDIDGAIKTLLMRPVGKE